MVLRPAHRLPRKFNRPISRVTRRVLDRKLRRSVRGRFSALWRRWFRSSLRSMEGWRRGIVRWAAVTLIALSILTVGIVLFSPIGRIEEITVVRTSRLDIEEVLRTLSPLFGRYLVSVTGREVRDLLDQRFADLATVDITKHYPSQLSVRITLDPLIARVRILEPDRGDRAIAGSGSIVGALTRHGVLTTNLSGSSAVLPIIDLVDWGVRPSIGTPILTADFLVRMAQAEEMLQTQFSQKVQRRVAYIRAQEFHLNVGGINLWFDMRSIAEDHLQRYRTFLRALGPKAAQQYIDLRLGDKVVYR